MSDPTHHESLAERRIRQAQDDGHFADLSGAGSPLPGLDRPYHPDWWARSYAERDRDRRRGAEASARADRILGRLWAVEDEGAAARTVDALNSYLERVNRGLHPEARVPLLDPTETMATWRRMSLTLRNRRPPVRP